MLAIEAGGDAAALVAKLRDLEARQRAIVGELASLRPVPRLAPAVIENRLAEWRRLLRASTTQGRTVLQRILCARLTFTPRVNPISGVVDGYDFEGPTRFDKLFTGIAVGSAPDRAGRPSFIPPGDVPAEPKASPTRIPARLTTAGCSPARMREACVLPETKVKSWIQPIDATISASLPAGVR
jgi:hypothetical protein